MLTPDDIAKIQQLLVNFATKDDLKGFATKDDLKAFATKDDINALQKRMEGFATKDDLKAFATKDDLQAFATKTDLKQEITGAKDEIKETTRVMISQAKLEIISETDRKLQNAVDNIVKFVTDTDSDSIDKLNDHEERISHLEKSSFGSL